VQGDYRNETVMAAAKADWHRVFRSMPRVDTLFVNAGDPGGQNPEDLIFLTQVAQGILKQYHPTATVWICPQDWSVGDYGRWLELSSLSSTKAWLDGIVYGPGMPVSLESFSNTTYPIRVRK